MNPHAEASLVLSSFIASVLIWGLYGVACFALGFYIAWLQYRAIPRRQVRDRVR